MPQERPLGHEIFRVVVGTNFGLEGCQNINALGSNPSRSIAMSTTELERKLWKAANILRSDMDAAEYKHVVLGLIFLKFVSDAAVAQQGRARDL